jgi:hypothetical protein
MKRRWWMMSIGLKVRFCPSTLIDGPSIDENWN